MRKIENNKSKFNVRENEQICNKKHKNMENFKMNWGKLPKYKMEELTNNY